MSQFHGEVQPTQRRFPGRVRTAPAVSGGFPPAPDLEGAPSAGPSPDPEPIQINVPLTFQELLYTIVFVNRARETPIVVEQTVPAGATGSSTVLIPTNEVDVQRFFFEGGDGSISYDIDIQAPGQTAIGSHRITGGTREFARYWEKTTQIIINFTNNDPVNPALIQIHWVAVRLETVKWTRYRDLLIPAYEFLGIEP